MDNSSNSILKSALFPLSFLLLIWMVFYFNAAYFLNLNEYGLRPGKWTGLWGILTMPLLHGDLGHILSNSLPLLVLGSCLFYFYKEVAFKVFFISYFACGLMVWIFAGNQSLKEVHIGASGLVYALSGFLLISGFIRKNKALFGVSLLVVFLYGTIVWGVLPPSFQKLIHYLPDDAHRISWEGHLFGFVSGLTLAIVYRKRGIQKPVYSWEINHDEDIDESDPYWLAEEPESSLQGNAPAGQEDVLKNKSYNPYTVNYTFIPKDKGVIKTD